MGTLCYPKIGDQLAKDDLKGEAVDDVLSQIRSLSSGTMATITGFNKYQIIDAIQAEWLSWETANKKQNRDWQSSWSAWMKVLGVEMKGNKANSDDLYQHFPLNLSGLELKNERLTESFDRMSVISQLSDAQEMLDRNQFKQASEVLRVLSQI